MSATFLVGNQEIFQLLSKTEIEIVRAMEIANSGCVLKSTKHKNVEMQDSMVFIPDVIIVGDFDSGKKLSTIVTGGEISDFVFTDITGAIKGAEITSNEITYAWSRDEADISIDYGAYSINDGDYTSSTGVIHYGDIVKIRLNASSSGFTKVTANLVIGAQTEAYEVTTGA